MLANRRISAPGPFQKVSDKSKLLLLNFKTTLNTYFHSRYFLHVQKKINFCASVAVLRRLNCNNMQCRIGEGTLPWAIFRFRIFLEWGRPGQSGPPKEKTSLEH